MTQHVLVEHTQEDQQIMRNLGLFVGMFAAAAVLLALGVSLFA